MMINGPLHTCKQLAYISQIWPDLWLQCRHRIRPKIVIICAGCIYTSIAETDTLYMRLSNGIIFMEDSNKSSLNTNNACPSFKEHPGPRHLRLIRQQRNYTFNNTYFFLHFISDKRTFIIWSLTWNQFWRILHHTGWGNITCQWDL